MEVEILKRPAPDGPKGEHRCRMMPDLAELLVEVRKAALTDRVIEYGGKPVRSVKRGFKAAVAPAGLSPSTSPHVLHHFGAVHIIVAGTSIVETAQYLGHSFTAVTYRIYARFSPDHLRKTAGALEWDVPSCAPVHECDDGK